MLSDMKQELFFVHIFTVLILVLMEYALWPNDDEGEEDEDDDVLILVLMEYALWHLLKSVKARSRQVLILVLMEYALWHATLKSVKKFFGSLNPCSNGICSLTEY